MILHSLRAGSPVVTDTGCCLSAARRRPTLGDTVCIARPRHRHTGSLGSTVGLSDGFKTHVWVNG
jgi:hypothetical protein